MPFKVGRSRLRDLLREKRMTQVELARRTGRSKSQISDLVNQKNAEAMSLRVAKDISHALDCHIEDLFEWEWYELDTEADEED
ncbi:helix-turn-helix transcriptional regulator [Fictibacillus sp. Mic-4]|uniref:helix-turn-helix domain-containing protein n=1 Tax=Fictibacillus sp. Mic-4 TaxID=3132826 RepID=UPI003CF6AE4C